MLEREVDARARVGEIAVPRERGAEHRVRFGQRLRDLECVERVARGFLEAAESELHPRQAKMRGGIARIALLRLFVRAARLRKAADERQQIRERKRHVGLRAHLTLDRVGLRARSGGVAREAQRCGADHLHLDVRGVVREELLRVRRDIGKSPDREQAVGERQRVARLARVLRHEPLEVRDRVDEPASRHQRHRQVEHALAAHEIDLPLHIARERGHVAEVDELLQRVGGFERVLPQLGRVQPRVAIDRVPRRHARWRLGDQRFGEHAAVHVLARAKSKQRERGGRKVEDGGRRDVRALLHARARHHQHALRAVPARLELHAALGRKITEIRPQMVAVEPVIGQQQHRHARTRGRQDAPQRRVMPLVDLVHHAAKQPLLALGHMRHPRRDELHEVMPDGVDRIEEHHRRVP